SPCERLSECPVERTSVLQSFDPPGNEALRKRRVKVETLRNRRQNLSDALEQGPRDSRALGCMIVGSLRDGGRPADSGAVALRIKLDHPGVTRLVAVAGFLIGSVRFVLGEVTLLDQLLLVDLGDGGTVLDLAV